MKLIKLLVLLTLCNVVAASAQLTTTAAPATEPNAQVIAVIQSMDLKTWAVNANQPRYIFDKIPDWKKQLAALTPYKDDPSALRPNVARLLNDAFTANDLLAAAVATKKDLAWKSSHTGAGIVSPEKTAFAKACHDLAAGLEYEIKVSSD